jgi:hypothetical protein
MLRQLKGNIPLTIVNVITNSRSENLTDVRRNIKHFGENGTTPIIIPKVDVCPSSKQPDRIVKNKRDLLFDATPYRRENVMMDEFLTSHNSSLKELSPRGLRVEQGSTEL